MRGVIEGFYGPPWTHATRLDVIEFLADRGMNAYVYAPKSDPKHRERWRDTYDADELDQFRELAERAADLSTRFGFAISPGLDIDYASSRDRDVLVEKLTPLLGAGVDWIVLAFDDIPSHPDLARAQAGLSAWLLDAVRSRRAGAQLTLVPTEYVGTRPTPYLHDLAARLPAEVAVMWTGPTVCSSVVRAVDARAWASALAGRRPLLWDNYPVNDGSMEQSLHLGPYRGREPELTDEIEGVLCNPMLQAHASKVALATAADFLGDPDRYDPEASWSRAIAAVGGRRRPALRALASACADGPLLPADLLDAHALVTAVADAADTASWPRAVGALRDHLASVRQARDAWSDTPDDPLGAEIGPWLDGATVEADAGLAALRLVQHVRPVARVDDHGRGKAAAPDADLAMLHAFAVLFAWGAARRGEHVVFGPRFAVYPAVVQLPDGKPGLDVDLAIAEDQSAIDRVCRFALSWYQAWSHQEPGPVRVTADDTDIEVAPDGTFEATAATDLVVRAGPASTAVAAGVPFPDPRLA